MIIDIHVHLVGSLERNGCYINPGTARGIMFRGLRLLLGLGSVPDDRLDDAYRDRLVPMVEESGLDGVCLLALDGVYDDSGELDRNRTSVLVGNDYCIEVCRASDKLFPACSVNPRRKDAIDELDRVAALGSVAIKVVPNSQGFDPGDRRNEAFWRRMADLKMPLISHTSFEHTIRPLNQAWGRPERLRLALECGVTVIAAHCAAAGVSHIHEDIGTWFAMLEEFPALYGDLSSFVSLARFPYLRKVLAHDLARERIILGSDFPIPVSPTLFLPQLGLVRCMALRRMKNPLQRNLETLRAMGVDDKALNRASNLLRFRAGSRNPDAAEPDGRGS